MSEDVVNLADGHDVRLEPEMPERPHVVARPAMATLDLVGDPQRARGVGRVEPLGRDCATRLEVSVAREYAVEDGGGRRIPARRQPRDGVRERPSVEMELSQLVRRIPGLDVVGRSARSPRLG